MRTADGDGDYHGVARPPLSEQEERHLTIFLTDAGEKAREWTATRDSMIREARQAGWSLRRIGETVGLTHGAIAKILAR